MKSKPNAGQHHFIRNKKKRKVFFRILSKYSLEKENKNVQRK